MSATILHLLPYPISRPQHGGQLRARAIHEALKAAGCSMRPLTLFDSRSYPDETPDIDVAPALSGLSGPWQVMDYLAGQAVMQHDTTLSRLAQSLSAQPFDLLILEEPWLSPPLLALRERGVFSAPLMHNSYNVEFEAKARILQSDHIADAEKLVTEIRTMETNLFRAADACSAVTQEDARQIANWCRKVVVAPNGTSVRKRRHLRGVLPQGLVPEVHYALFVGSAHPPNVSGVMDLLLPALAQLKSHERILLAGSLCGPVQQRLQDSDLPFMTRDKLELCGFVSDFRLDCLIENAAALVLPIPYGGGSNLKTAEALLAGKPIVATPAAFRGYETFRDFPQVRLADTATGFAAALRDTLDQPPRCDTASPALQQLQWSHTLQPIVETALALCGRNP